METVPTLQGVSKYREPTSDRNGAQYAMSAVGRSAAVESERAQLRVDNRRSTRSRSSELRRADTRSRCSGTRNAIDYLNTK